MTSKSRLRKLVATLCLIGGLAAFGSGFAQDASPITITNAVYQQVDDELVPAKNVVPGGEVIYRISYSNNGQQEATDVAIDNPLPGALVYVGAEDEPTEVSVDGGETFGKLEDLAVVDADGSVRPARIFDITNLRWVISSLPPGASGDVTYRARVK